METIYSFLVATLGGKYMDKKKYVFFVVYYWTDGDSNGFDNCELFFHKNKIDSIDDIILMEKSIKQNKDDSDDFSCHIVRKPDLLRIV